MELIKTRWLPVVNDFPSVAKARMLVSGIYFSLQNFSATLKSDPKPSHSFLVVLQVTALELNIDLWENENDSDPKIVFASGLI